MSQENMDKVVKGWKSLKISTNKRYFSQLQDMARPKEAEPC